MENILTYCILHRNSYSKANSVDPDQTPCFAASELGLWVNNGFTYVPKTVSGLMRTKIT